MLAEFSQTCSDAVWFKFSANRPTLTEDIVNGKLPGLVWDGAKGWFGRKNQTEKGGCNEPDE